MQIQKLKRKFKGVELHNRVKTLMSENDYKRLGLKALNEINFAVIPTMGISENRD